MNIRLPITRGDGWYKVFAYIFLFNFSFIVISRLFIGSAISFQNLFGFLILSVIFSLLALVGYYGARIWSYSIISSNIIGLLYMLYTSIFRTSEGWTDLISIISLITLVIIGVVGGLLVQVVYWLSHRKQ